MAVFYQPEKIDDRHAFAADRLGECRFPDDDRLRAVRPAFRIASRPKRGEAIWLREGRRYTSSAALASIREEEH